MENNQSKQKAEFDAYKNYCAQNNLSACRVENLQKYLATKI